jgi:hypothetical protein
VGYATCFYAVLIEFAHVPLTRPYIYFARCQLHVYSAKVVVYDLKENVRFTITEDWDRSPDSIIVSSSSSNCPYFLYSISCIVILVNSLRVLSSSHASVIILGS